MSGGGGETNTVSKFEPPDYTVEPWKQYVSNVQSLTSGDMPRYQGQTVAPMTQQHMTGQNMLMNLATNGTAAGNAAQSQLYNTMQGAFDDPYATTLNPYAGMNPYLSGVIDQSNAKIADAYARGTAAQLDRAHALSRTFGSTGQQEAQQRNETALAEGIAANTQGLLSDQYNKNAGLAENQLNRASGALQNERNRQLQAAGMAPQVQQGDLQAIQALMAGGDAQRNYQQELLGAQAQDWWNWFQGPYAQMDTLGSALTRASGGAGTTSNQVMGGMNPMQAAMGLGMLGLGAYQGGMFG